MRNYGKIADRNTSLEQAWQLSNSIVGVREDFETHCQLFQRHYEWGYHAFWAYWFTRFVIHDHWPLAETFIQQDESAWAAYQTLINIYRQAKILDSSINGDIDFETDEKGRIIQWRPERLPRMKQKWRKTETAEEIADRIAQEVAVFKKSKLLRTDELSDEDLF